VKEQLEQHLLEYVNKVKENYESCKNNEAATKASLIAPLFALLGWDLANPKECMPEYRADFGKGEKAATPMDWVFALPPFMNAFIVEAKESGKKLKLYAEQLGMYFTKVDNIHLGIFSNGIQWQFYSDVDKPNKMDKEPFLTWDVLNDNAIPIDFLKILQKSQFKPQHVTLFAQKGWRQNKLVERLTKLLEPSDEFIKLAITGYEDRNHTKGILEEWKPILANAIREWAKVKSLRNIWERPSESVEKGGETAKHTRHFIGRTCPDCHRTGLGFRLKQCDCGHVFAPSKADDADDSPDVKEG
jgi:hypothetical protein